MIVKAIKEQADLLCYCDHFSANEKRALLGKLIAELTPSNHCKSFFTTGGAEPNENALKITRR